MSRTKSATTAGVEGFLKDWLAKIAEASYRVALRTGFRGSFISFLSDLQEALEIVIERDRRRQRRSRPRVHSVAVH